MDRGDAGLRREGCDQWRQLQGNGEVHEEKQNAVDRDKLQALILSLSALFICIAASIYKDDYKLSLQFN